MSNFFEQTKGNRPMIEDGQELPKDQMAELTKANKTLLQQANSALEANRAAERENKRLLLEIELLHNQLRERQDHTVTLYRVLAQAIEALETIHHDPELVQLGPTGERLVPTEPWDRDSYGEAQAIALSAAHQIRSMFGIARD